MGNRASKAQNNGEGVVILVLPPDFRMAELADVQKQLQGLFAHAQVALDADKVERIDTAALQLLLAFRRDAIAHGIKPAWKGASKVLREAGALLGLTNALELPAWPA